ARSSSPARRSDAPKPSAGSRRGRCPGTPAGRCPRSSRRIRCSTWDGAYATVERSTVAISLGVDTLCWHLLLENGQVTVEQVFEQAHDLGCAVVQVNLHPLRARPGSDLERLRERAAALGLRLLASGDFLGQARLGDDPATGVARVDRWL